MKRAFALIALLLAGHGYAAAGDDDFALTRFRTQTLRVVDDAIALALHNLQASPNAEEDMPRILGAAIGSELDSLLSRYGHQFGGPQVRLAYLEAWLQRWAETMGHAVSGPGTGPYSAAARPPLTDEEAREQLFFAQGALHIASIIGERDRITHFNKLTERRNLRATGAGALLGGIAGGLLGILGSLDGTVGAGSFILFSTTLTSAGSMLLSMFGSQIYHDTFHNRLSTSGSSQEAYEAGRLQAVNAFIAMLEKHLRRPLTPAMASALRDRDASAYVREYNALVCEQTMVPAAAAVRVPDLAEAVPVEDDADDARAEAKAKRST